MPSKKPIKQITKFTTLDYANHLSCIAWFSGCNMRCQYCYNPKIVEENGCISINEFLSFLKTRQNLLDAVVLSGGECTLYRGLKELCYEIKKLNFKIKIDTNGTNVNLLKELVSENLVDFIAIDYKAPKSKFEQITKNDNFDKFEESLSFLINANFNFEARTTVHNDLLDENDINEIIKDLYYKNYKFTYFLQFFLETQNLGNLKQTTKKLNLDKLSTLLPIFLRNT